MLPCRRLRHSMAIPSLPSAFLARPPTNATVSGFKQGDRQCSAMPASFLSVAKFKAGLPIQGSRT